MRYLLILLCVPVILGVKKLCPGGSYTCPDSATCCELTDHSYGCCPIAGAVCCSDHIHCCPPNHTCSAGLCLDGSGASLSAASAANSSAPAHPIRTNNVVCPDQQVCPSQTTCCKNDPLGTYGCCPLQAAVCCGDGIHCCPNDTRCNLEHGRCDPVMLSHPTLSAFHEDSSGGAKASFSPLVAANATSVICPDNIFQCPDRYTCCKLPNGHWGCCPFTNAMCCLDHLHCCPENMKCDISSQFCSQSDIATIASQPKVAAEKVSEGIVCPDRTHCQPGQTCCQLEGRKYGCCQYSGATCCSDKQHCCPSGFTCNVEKRKCVPPFGNWASRFLSRYFDESTNEV